MDLSEAIQATWDKIGSWLAGAIQALPNLVVAVIIVVLFVFIARFARDWSYRLLGRVSEYRAVNRLLSTVTFVALLALGATIALTVLNLGTAVASILGAAGILGLAIGFAAQNTVENVIAGILISVHGPMREGDLVESHDVFGRVQEINLRTTILLTPTGQLVYVPNGELFRTRLTNYSRLGQRRVDLACGVSYAEDLEAVRQVAIEAIEGVEQRIPGKDVEFYYEEFGGSSIDFVVRFWIPFNEPARRVQAGADRRHHRPETGVRRERDLDPVPDPHARFRNPGRRQGVRGAARVRGGGPRNGGTGLASRADAVGLGLAPRRRAETGACQAEAGGRRARDEHGG